MSGALSFIWAQSIRLNLCLVVILRYTLELHSTSDEIALVPVLKLNIAVLLKNRGEVPLCLFSKL